MKLITLVLSALIGALTISPAIASTDDPSSPFYLLPTKSQGTTLHAERTY